MDNQNKLSHRNSFAFGNGANKLAQAITSRVQDGQDDARTMDYGVINGDWSLQTNQFGVNIPKGDWSVCRHLVGGEDPDFNWYTQPEKENSAHGAQSHKHLTYPTRLKPGDRVLVAWIGNDACVIDVVWSSDRFP